MIPLGFRGGFLYMHICSKGSKICPSNKKRCPSNIKACPSSILDGVFTEKLIIIKDDRSVGITDLQRTGPHFSLYLHEDVNSKPYKHENFVYHIGWLLPQLDSNLRTDATGNGNAAD